MVTVVCAILNWQMYFITNSREDEFLMMYDGDSDVGLNIIYY